MLYINSRFTYLLYLLQQVHNDSKIYSKSTQVVQPVHTTKVNSASHSSGVGKSSTGLHGWVKAGRVYLRLVTGSTVILHGNVTFRINEMGYD